MLRRLLGVATAVALAVTPGAAHGFAPLGQAPLLDTRLGRDAPSVPARVHAARRRWARTAELSVDRIDGGLRWLGRTDGYLSGPSAGPPRRVARRWARANLDVLGLERRDLRGLRLVEERRAPNGVTRLVFEQRHRGVPAFDDTLRVNVDPDGRVVNAGGSPKSRIRVRSIRPALSAREALLAGSAAVGARVPQPRRARPHGALRRFAGGHTARLVIASTGPRRGRLAWRIWLDAPPAGVWSLLVDGSSGRLIRRASQVKAAGQGLAFDAHPGAPRGGSARRVDLRPWLGAADRLRGGFVHVYNDFDGTESSDTAMVDPTRPRADLVMPHEEIRPSGGGDWLHPYRPVASPNGNCPPAGCTWNHQVNGSWLANRDQDGTQVFFFVNRFAEHLAAPPIGFDEGAGNFRFDDPSGRGKGGDGIYASSMDSAGQLAGRPVPVLRSNNATMTTPPDGRSPRLELYLFEPLPEGTGLVGDYPFSDVSAGSDATIVYHELTHGLTNRVVVDAAGEGALSSAQGGALGEGFSDFYAVGFLLGQGLLDDTPAPGEVRMGPFVDRGGDLVRTEALDCTVGAPREACPRRRSPLGGGGGYTYADFGRVAGEPQVHADGEIWGQTLLDLRRRLVADLGPDRGGRRLLSHVTRALELAPVEPSFIDMRNAILQADTVAGGRDRRRIWEVFARRGMGASASARDGSDTAPVAAFDLPPGLPPADVEPPRLTVETPSEGAVVRAEATRVAGTVVDDVEVVELTVAGRPVRVDGSRWAIELELPRGRQALRVVARDAEDRTAALTRNVVVDARRPRLRRVSARRRLGRVLVGGIARDDVGIRHVRAGRKRVAASRRGRFSMALERRRARTVRIVAVDHVGRKARRRVRVR